MDLLQKEVQRLIKFRLCNSLEICISLNTKYGTNSLNEFVKKIVHVFEKIQYLVRQFKTIENKEV